jgi:hypothetical protein
MFTSAITRSSDREGRIRRGKMTDSNDSKPDSNTILIPYPDAQKIRKLESTKGVGGAVKYFTRLAHIVLGGESCRIG